MRLGIPLSIEKAVPALLAGDELTDRPRPDRYGTPIRDRRRRRHRRGNDRRNARLVEASLGVLAYAIMGSRAALRAIMRRDFFDVRVEVTGSATIGVSRP